MTGLSAPAAGPGRRTSSVPAALAIAAVAGVAIFVIGVDADGGGEPETPPPTASAEGRDGCILLDDSEMTLLTSGIVGTPLGATLRSGIRPGFRVGSLFAVQIPADQFGQPWFAVSGWVFDGGHNPVGVATWLSPQLRAVFGGEPPRPEAWAAAPADHPDETHVYAADHLAAEVSVWRPFRVDPASQRAAAGCVDS